MKIKQSKGEIIFKIFNYAFLSLLALLCLYPFWHVVMSSFSDAGELSKHTGLLLMPKGFSLDAYKIVLEDEAIWTGFRNTLFLLIVGVPLSVIMTALAAYFFSRRNVLFKKPLLLFVMIPMYFTGGTIPFYLTLRDLNLTGTLWGLILPFICATYYVIILRTSFESIPESIYDAAKIDGAGHIRTLIDIVLPLSKASIAVIAMYYGMGIWNGWFWGTAILRNESQFPLQVVLRNILIMSTADATQDANILETAKYATIVVSVVPVLLIYPMLQKYFTKGVMIGAVKE